MHLLFALVAAAELSAAASAGSRGEHHAEAVAHASSDGLGFTLGAAESEGPGAPPRTELLLGGEAGVFGGELRVVPGAEGLLRVAGEAGVHFESLGLVLGARTTSLGRRRLRAAGARLELEGQLTDEVRAGLSVSAWALQLDAPPSRDAWTAFGESTLDWAQRCEAGAWASLDLSGWLSVAPSISAAQAAQPGTWEARAGLAVEVPLGALRLKAEGSVARQWPELWMLDLTLGVTMSVD